MSIPNLSWDNERHRVCKWMKDKSIGGQSKHHTSKVLEKAVESLSTTVRSPQCTKTWHITSAPKRTPNKWSSTVQTHGMWKSPKQIYAKPSHWSTAWRKITHRQPGGQRTASCANASLPRVQETWWQQETGAEGRGVRPRRWESWSR